MNMMLKAGLASALIITSVQASAREVSVEITNLTNGIYFTPLLVAAHNKNAHLFELGEAASSNLQAMAEGGSIAGLVSDVTQLQAKHVANPAGGLLKPGASTTAELSVRGRKSSRLSIVGMMLPTNDGFIGLDAYKIPKRSGTYTLYLYGYDAGTEANDEIVNGGGAPGVPGIPADPGGNSGQNASGAAGPDNVSTVHIHRGIIGDTDPNGGISDLDSRVHSWLNPVARVTVTVSPDKHDYDYGYGYGYSYGYEPKGNSHYGSNYNNGYDFYR